MCLTLAVCVAWISPKNETASNASAIDNKHSAYVDLGLPSGTKWKATNEPGMFDYEAATTRFEGKLPTAIQLYELCNKCKWTWLGNGYRVTGPNGNCIFMGIDGYYWSRTSVNNSTSVFGTHLQSFNLGWGIFWGPQGWGSRVRAVR